MAGLGRGDDFPQKGSVYELVSPTCRYLALTDFDAEFQHVFCSRVHQISPCADHKRIIVSPLPGVAPLS